MSLLNKLKKQKKDKTEVVEEITEIEKPKAEAHSNLTTGHFIVKKPLVSEKAVSLSSKRKYVFVVDGESSSQEIRKAIENIYKVEVDGVNVISIIKTKPNRRSRKKLKIPIKKAIVTLAVGQELDIIPK